MISLLNYTMGIKFGGVSIPDPSEWNPSIADVDESAERDAHLFCTETVWGRR